MSQISTSLHAKVAVDRMAVVLARVYERAGYEPVQPNVTSEGTRRIMLRAERGWCSVADDAWNETSFDPNRLDELEVSAALSRELSIPVLSLWAWDGEASVIARHFETGEEVSRLEL